MNYREIIDNAESSYTTISLQIASSYRVTGMNLTVNQFTGKIDVDMSSYTASGSLENFKGFAFKTSASEEKSDIIDYWSFLNNENIEAINYRYTHNGKNEAIKKNKEQLDNEDMDAKIKSVFRNIDFVQINNPIIGVESPVITLSASDTAQKKSTEIKMYTDFMSIEKIGTVVHYSYGNSGILGKLEAIFTHWKTPDEQEQKSEKENTATADESAFSKESPELQESENSSAETGQIFLDVSINHWAYKYIDKFFHAGIVNGIGDNLFAPDNHVTYEHFDFLLERLFNYTGNNTQQLPALRQDVISALVKAMKLENSSIQNDNILSDNFQDFCEISDENISNIKIAVEAGLAYGDGIKINANSYITRAEAVTLLYRGICKIYGINDDDVPENYLHKIQNNEWQ